MAQILATGFARVAPSHMPQAPVPAANAALADAGLTIGQVDAVTTHNPFAVNDIYFSRQTGFPLDRMNSYGCSLIFGHPQGPTGLRSIAELIEELRQRGGGEPALGSRCFLCYLSTILPALHLGTGDRPHCARDHVPA